MSSDAVGWITELDPHSRQLVAAFRHAAAALQEEWDFGAAVQEDLAGVVGWRRSREAVAHFRTLMETIGLHARRDVRFHVPLCPCLGADEAAFIRIHDRVATGAVAEAEAIAHDMVESHAVMTLLHYASLLTIRCPGGAPKAGMATKESCTTSHEATNKPTSGRLH